MLVFSQVPRQRPERIGMSQELADIGWSHPHFVHPGRRGSACPVRGDASDYVSLADSGQLAQEWNYTLIEEVSSHEFVGILEEIACRLTGIANNQRLFIWRGHDFPHFNGIRHIRS